MIICTNTHTHTHTHTYYSPITSVILNKNCQFLFMSVGGVRAYNNNKPPYRILFIDDVVIFDLDLKLLFIS